jgi:hypothetical protein
VFDKMGLGTLAYWFDETEDVFIGLVGAMEESKIL